jgi:acid phosphatase (class A)
MRIKLIVSATLLFAATLLATAQDAIQEDFKACIGVSADNFNYLDPAKVDFAHLLSAPPGLAETIDADLPELRHVDDATGLDQKMQANNDGNELDMFIFRSVLGQAFNADILKQTRILSRHLCQDATLAGARLKMQFRRPRPYETDPALHTYCQRPGNSPSYPSGHAMTGYLEALALSEILPEFRARLMARAAEYAHNRAVCGVHFPSDIAAGRYVAYALFDRMKSSPNFIQEMKEAREEIRAHFPDLFTGAGHPE